MDKSVVALLLAKSKSTRLPGKNMLDFNGKPMLQWNLEKCLELFDRVYVSSDSDEILNFAQSFGAIGIKRGEDLCGDVPDIPVYLHALAEMEKGGMVSGIVAVHVDTPTLRLDTIDDIALFLEIGYDEVMTCHPMTRADNYKEQHNAIFGSVRGMSRERLINYGDPYKPNPEMLIVDDSVEIEDLESYNRAQWQALTRPSL